MAIYKTYRFNFIFILCLVLFTFNFMFFFTTDASAVTQVTLEWSPNSEPDLAGYRVFLREEGQSYDYTYPSWEGTEPTATIYNIDETKTYYFVARAFDTEGFESGDSNEVCLEPAGEPPIANAGPDQTVDEGRLITLNGSNSTDPDDGIASYHWMQTGGPQVTLSDANGQQSTFTAPNVGADGASLIFELTVVDQGGLESTDSCVVNVTWLNEPPEANAGLDQTVDEGGVVALDGSSSLDIDGGITAYLWTQISGPAVVLSDPAFSQPTFTAPDVGPDGVSLTFNLTVTDTGDLQDTDSCIVNISWQNEPPTAVVAEEYIEADQGTTVTLDGSGSTDTDDGIASYLWTQVDGDPVTLSDPTSNVTTFTAPETGQDGSNLTFQLTITDFGGLQSTAECSVYITQMPIADAGSDQTVNYGQIVTLNSNSTDPDGEVVSYQWTQVSGTPVTLSDPASAQTTFTAPDVGPDGDILTFSLTVTDNSGLQGTDICTIIINPSSGDDQPGQVTLEWSPNSEPDLAGYRVFLREEGQSYDYTNPSWEGTETTCTIYNLDETKTYYFVARAFDTEGLESGDSNEVCLEPAGEPPIANAGPDQTVDEGRLITLNGSNSTDPDDGIASYHWMQTGGPQVTLSDANGQQSTFTAPNVGADGASLIFELTVVDQGGLESTDSCVVNVTWLNEPPEANAGLDQTVDEGGVVALDGSSSLDIDGGITAYLWTQISGPAVVLSDPAFSQPTFTAPDVGPDGVSLTFNLTVTDTGDLQDTDSCIVNISWQNEPPTAVVAEEYIEADQGTTVTLDGSGSTDTDDGIVSYLWTQVDGTPVTLSDPASDVTTFIAPETDQNGTNMIFLLTVTDSGGLQSTADCSVCIRQNELPTVNISSPSNGATFTSGDVICLVGTAQDTEDGNITANLVWTSGIDGQIGTGGSCSKILSVGTHTITASVDDSDGAHDSKYISVNITPENNPPLADAGEDQVVDEDNIVILDGSHSSDPDGEIVSYQWTQISGTPVTLAGPTSVLPTFIAPDVDSVEETLSFRLTVIDNGGLEGTDTCSVTVSPEAQTDNVTITSAIYISKRKTLSIKAVSDAPARSATLTAWANYGTETVKLGELKYSYSKKYYGKTFRNINSAPDTVTVTSSGGGSDTM